MALPLDFETIESCLDATPDTFNAVFRRVKEEGLASLSRSERSGHLWRVVGEVAESVAEIVLDDLGYRVFWHVTEPGGRGVDLLFLSPDESVLALEVKGTLRAGMIPRNQQSAQGPQTGYPLALTLLIPADAKLQLRRELEHGFGYTTR